MGRNPWSIDLSKPWRGFRYRRYRVPDDAAYSVGDGPWSSLGNLSEVPHQAVVAGYVRRLVPEGAILDVGCGEGLLLEQLDDRPYTGIDLSQEAVLRARPRTRSTQQRVLVADAESWDPEIPYRAVVFQECLYYMSDPLSVYDRYVKGLQRHGYAIVSMYDAPSTRALWRRLRSAGPILDLATVASARGTTWSVACFGPY